MRQVLATGLAFLAAATVPAAYFAAMHPLSGQRDPLSIAGTFLVAFFFAAVATVVFGLPAFLILRRLKFIRWWAATGWGALAGVMSITAVRFSLSIEPAVVVRFALLGGVAGLLFWAVWRTGSQTVPVASDV